MIMRIAFVSACVALSGCGTADAPPVACRGPCGDGPMFAVTTFAPATAAADGSVEGFDLDGAEGTVRADCEGTDWRDAAGRGGIDHQFAEIMPLLEGLVGEAPKQLVQNAINDGGLLILAELVGSGANGGDGPVHVVFHRGAGVPLLGTDTRLLAGQTYELADVPLSGVCPSARVEGDILTCGPFELAVTAVVFGKSYPFSLRGAQVRLVRDDAGGGAMVLGGGVPVADIEALAEIIGDVDGLKDIVLSTVPPFADLVDPATGECDAISVSFQGALRTGFGFAPGP